MALWQVALLGAVLAALCWIALILCTGDKKRTKKMLYVGVVGFSLIILGLCFQTSNFYSPHSPSERQLDSVRTRLLYFRNNNSGIRIATAWVFDSPLPPDVLTNIYVFSGAPVHVYCGTSQCVQAITELNIPSITTELMVVSNLVRNTPLEQWFVRHPLYKVLAGIEFEAHLQRVAQLGILWHRGGLFVDPLVRLTGGSVKTTLTEQSFSQGELDISFFPKHHPFIWTLAEHFVKNYPKEGNGSYTFHFSFHKVLKTATANYCNKSQSDNCLDSAEVYYIRYNKQHQDLVAKKNHFGTLSYDLRTKTYGGSNIGDEIQALSGLQFLPFADVLLERDKTNVVTTTEPVTAFFNAWWGDPYMFWPPARNINPIMTSMHTTPDGKNIFSRNIDYLKKHAPIGCRDLSTLEFMRKHKVESYFSACMTLMTRNPFNGKSHTGKVYLVDVKPEQSSHLIPLEVRKQAINVGHYKKGMRDGLKQFSTAYSLLEIYASAKVVITQRIHCALPCVGMGIPVIFIQSRDLPGDIDTKVVGSPRTAGLTPLFHTVDLYKMSPNEAKDWLERFDWDNPPPNPNPGLLMKFRATFWDVIRQDQALYDSARKFGMIPLPQPPTEDSEQLPGSQLTFHLVFENSNLDGSDSTLRWRHWRGVESILYHHPFAKVTIHSNTLQQSEFDVLTEAGYAIEVQRYDLREMIKNSPAQDLKLSNAVESPQILSQQVDLLRLLVLYKHGGIFVDTDMIFVNPVGSLKNDVLAWKDPSNHSLSSAFLSFENGSQFLRDCLAVLTQHYNNKERRADILTEVWKEEWKSSTEVAALKSSVFYMFPNHSSVKEECLTTIPNTMFEEKTRVMKEEVFAVQLDSADIGQEIGSAKVPEGTICSYLLNTFCVLCNKLY